MSDDKNISLYFYKTINTPPIQTEKEVLVNVINVCKLGLNVTKNDKNIKYINFTNPSFTKRNIKFILDYMKLYSRNPDFEQKTAPSKPNLLNTIDVIISRNDNIEIRKKELDLFVRFIYGSEKFRTKPFNGKNYGFLILANIEEIEFMRLINLLKCAKYIKLIGLTKKICAVISIILCYHLAPEGSYITNSNMRSLLNKLVSRDLSD